MKKTGIFYGSTTGTTGEVAKKLARLMGIDPSDVHDVARCEPTDVGDYAVLLLGTSTWGSGDLQDDWADFVNGLRAIDLTGKQVALFGCGDESMSGTFCDGVGILYDDLKDTGCEFVGAFNADGYMFDHSAAVRDGKVVGLVLDNVNHADLTPVRLQEWTEMLRIQTAD